jgi:hypothetical protein
VMTPKHEVRIRFFHYSKYFLQKQILVAVGHLVDTWTHLHRIVEVLAPRRRGFMVRQ